MKDKDEEKKGGFQKENQLWKTRYKHGRDRIFQSPHELKDAAEAYFKWNEESPLYGAEYKDGGLVQIPYRRPLTLKAFTIFIDVTESYFRTFKSLLKSDDPLRDDFLTVFDWIEKTIYSQKFEGAAVGQFKEGLIARDLGLADKHQVETNINLGDKPIEFD